MGGFLGQRALAHGLGILAQLLRRRHIRAHFVHVVEHALDVLPPRRRVVLDLVETLEHLHRDLLVLGQPLRWVVQCVRHALQRLAGISRFADERLGFVRHVLLFAEDALDDLSTDTMRPRCQRRRRFRRANVALG